MEDHCSYSRDTPNSERNPEFRHCRMGMVLHSTFNTEAFINQLVSAANMSAIPLYVTNLYFLLTLILQEHNKPDGIRAGYVAAVFPPPGGIKAMLSFTGRQKHTIIE